RVGRWAGLGRWPRAGLLLDWADVRPRIAGDDQTKLDDDRESPGLGWIAEGNDLRGGPSSGQQGKLGKVMRSVAQLDGRRKPGSSREACARAEGCG
ncbi:hypothetical protein CRG98_047573, partial [Punica granatum]